ncbi:MAG: serine/threonine protein kinase [Leptolyngbya sp. LCM1.Bin17]|nr:MAG: serine/threonine protein kinase [Leptolyngbya sp. LCM1.Bin17]
MDGTEQGERLIGGRYRILRQLGQGSFGDTYLAEDVHRFQELCVLKEFNPQVEGKPALDKAQMLFEREAGILYQLNHPQIPRFRELLRDQGRLFLVQDYVEGPTYRELLNRRIAYDGPFSEAEVTRLLMQLLPVLQYLHSIGIVHRDISPDNLVQRNADGRPMLIDFGGVKQLVVNVRHQLGVPDPYQSVSGQVTRLGEGGYAPEEQLETGRVDPTTDLYALGMTALVLLTGKEPEDLYDDRTQAWTWPNQLSLSPTVRQVLDRMVAQTPRDRYVTAGQVMAALNLAQPTSVPASLNQPMPVRMQPITPPPPLNPPPPPPTRAVVPPLPYDPTATLSAPPRAVSPKRSSSGFWPALVVLFVVVAVLAGLWRWLPPLELGFLNREDTLDDTENPAFSEAEQARKQAIRDRALALNVDPTYLTQLTDQLFFERHPERQGNPLTDQPQDEALRAEWDTIAQANLDLLEANLSTDARSRLGRYNPSDRDRWQRQVNQMYVSSRALYDLTNARFAQIFPDRAAEGFVETPVDQIRSALAQDQVTAMETGDILSEIQFEPDSFSQQVQGTLSPGHGTVYILNLSAEQLMRLNLQAPPDSTRLSFFVPLPDEEVPYLLNNSSQNTWAGELPQTGFYEVVIISRASNPINYRLTTAVDNVIDDIINRPQAPAKSN